MKAKKYLFPVIAPLCGAEDPFTVKPKDPQPDEPTTGYVSSNPDLELELDKVYFAGNSKEYLADLDLTFCRALSAVLRSGKATVKHMDIIRQYLKDKNVTLDELAKQDREAEDSDRLEDLDLPFGNA